MGLGSEAAVGASADIGGTGAAGGPLGAGLEGGGVGAGAGGGGAGGIMAFLQDPKNIQTIGEIVKQLGALQGTTNKLPSDAKQFMTQALIAGASRMGGGGNRGGAPMLGAPGAIAPSQGPYLGDAASYQIDPQLAQRALQGMGISY